MKGGSGQALTQVNGRLRARGRQAAARGDRGETFQPFEEKPTLIFGKTP